MQLPYFDRQTVEQSLSMARCIPLMADSMLALYRQQASAPQRLTAPLLSADKHLMVMPGVLATNNIAGVKCLSLYPHNPEQGRPAVQGLITLFDLNSGAPIATVDAASITLIRTAAASAAATDALARADASTLTLLGTGPQALSHLQAMMQIRPINRVHCWGRSPEKVDAFIARAQPDLPAAVTLQSFSRVEAAVRDADIICTLTGSPSPILQRQWLKPGCHLTLVGSHSPTTREVDSDTIKAARLFVEVKAAALQEAGDILIPLQEGAIELPHIIGEIAQVISGEIKGRSDDQQITIYKSLGNATQDLAAAYEVLRVVGGPR